MSTYLWQFFLEDNVDNFRLLLANANYNASKHHNRPHALGGSSETTVGSPGKGLATSPNASTKLKRPSGAGHDGYGLKASKKLGDITLTRGDINSKDNRGITLLHLAASSTLDSASSFAIALLEIPLLDLYLQDLESGWTALHRALYFGNATIARALMNRDLQNSTIGGAIGGVGHTGDGLLKIKDREGNSPFDLYGSSITTRMIRHDENNITLSIGAEGEEDEVEDGENGDGSEGGIGSRTFKPRSRIDGDELFTFGSNKNLTLGFGDEDDRQYPERVHLKRPEHLLRRLQAEHRVQSRSIRMRQGQVKSEPLSAVVQFRPIIIQDVQLSKFHSAVLTTDPEANLYICGFGPGGRLGTGDEKTRFNFTPIYGGGLSGKKVIQIALGQNHSLAVSGEGELFTWGNNAFGQLGYSMPSSNAKDEDPVQLLPRQVFGPLKREIISGIAASRLHSVAYTTTSLYTFGKNDGQLGLVDSDARSLAAQVTPRKVAASLFSSPISMAAAIDKATICLLENHDVWIFANYGYTKMVFSYDEFSNFYLKQTYSMGSWVSADNHICKIGAGGDTICALSKRGDVFTSTVSQTIEAAPSTTSTTNPVKIRGALSLPQRIWSMRKGHMAVRDVDVGQDGSVIICTDSGSVWRRVKRAKIKDTHGAGSSKPKDYKFSRVPGLTRIAAVRSNAFGAFAAIRRDCDVLQAQVDVSSYYLWDDVFRLLPFHCLAEEDSDTEEPLPRFWRPRESSSDPATIRHAILQARNLEDTIANALPAEEGLSSSSLVMVGTTTSSVLIPCHDFILAGRSKVLREALTQFRTAYYFSIPDAFTIEYDKSGNIQILFQGLDFLTLINLVLFMYSDAATFTAYEKQRTKKQDNHQRCVRVELMRLAAGLEMRQLEQAARLVSSPGRSMHNDLEKAILDQEYFRSGDIEVQLKDGSMKIHSAMVCQRCPFFDGLFNGRAGGIWLADRRDASEDKQEAVGVDLQHVTLEVFRLVQRHIYADTEEELFDDIVASDEDAYLDQILDVLAVANELMLERLSQICQKVLGRYVNMRNVCQLLNVVSPCSVTEFKEAALEYLCLNLEGMLENHYLDELDDDLMLELDQVIRDNQLARLPVSKSGHAEAKLLEDHPELIEIMERNRRAKIDFMSLQSHFNEDDEMKELGTSKSKVDLASDGTPSPRLKAKSGVARSQSHGTASPSLRGQRSMNDLMFPIHDLPEAALSDIQPDSVQAGGRQFFGPESSQPNTLQASLLREDTWYDAKGKEIASSPLNSLPNVALGSPPSQLMDISQRTQSSGDKARATSGSGVWGASSFTPQRLDMRDIFEQTSATQPSTQKSALSQQISAISKLAHGSNVRISQKERKKQLQQQQLNHPLQEPAIPSTAVELPATPSSSSPAWQTTHSKPKVSLQDIFAEGVSPTPTTVAPSAQRRPSALTMRQTVPGNATPSKTPAPHPVPPTRSLSGPQNLTPARKSRPSLPSSSSSTPDAKLIPQSIRHTSLPAEPSLNLSMADILSQQQTEKDIIREVANAKRSLQEIQEEQAFQEWWDQESKKVQEEEERGKGGEKRGRGKSRGRGRGGARSERGGARGRAAAHEAAPGSSRGMERGESRSGVESQRGRGRKRAVDERGSSRRQGERGGGSGVVSGGELPRE